jgi:signal transduction histidine kinase
MNRTLRVLNVENSEQDAALLTRFLSRSGSEIVSDRVDTPEAMTQALESREWDVVLCDYSMPKFNALAALALMKEMKMDIPFIVISGSVGEAVAVEAMRAGAHDYLMKDNLMRLVPTIERELQEAENRRARRRVEEQLRDERKLFEGELQEKNLELEKANLAKDRFLASMSHELRTPLNAIIGFTGTLLMRLPGPLTSDQEQQLGIVQSSAKHQLSLINDLLDLAKIESGKVEIKYEPIVCQTVIEEVAAVLRPLAEKKGLDFSVKAPKSSVRVESDRRILNQILINLTNNAIKFTDKGKVHIELGTQTVNGQILASIDVSDTGIGIRREDKEKLFQAFQQVDVDHRGEGTGLGLYLSQKLAFLIKGRIELESEYGKGSVFRLLIPQD